jgi:hypothetical protein
MAGVWQTLKMFVFVSSSWRQNVRIDVLVSLSAFSVNMPLSAGNGDF